MQETRDLFSQHKHAKNPLVLINPTTIWCTNIDTWKYLIWEKGKKWKCIVSNPHPSTQSPPGKCFFLKLWGHLYKPSFAAGMWGEVLYVLSFGASPHPKKCLVSVLVSIISWVSLLTCSHYVTPPQTIRFWRTEIYHRFASSLIPLI